MPASDLPIRVYADTSVYGGAFDDEFAADSRAFFAEVRAGRFTLVLSAVVQAELEAAPEPVAALFREVLPRAEVVAVTAEALGLQEAYLDAGILTPKWSDDALHVALATVSGCPLIVSWNFRHIVHFEKIPRYNAVNVLQGYGPLAIHAPPEVLYSDEPETDDEDEEAL